MALRRGRDGVEGGGAQYHNPVQRQVSDIDPVRTMPNHTRVHFDIPYPASVV